MRDTTHDPSATENKWIVDMAEPPWNNGAEECAFRAAQDVCGIMTLDVKPEPRFKE